MTAPVIPASRLDALNDNELEILRLLANGHTAKSIARHLGRSETAVHERLRDARRKTGVGSSRELARLLDAQKIWDKKIDLSKPDKPRETLEPPPLRGPSLSKGACVMLIATSIAAIGLAVASGAVPMDPDPVPIDRAGQAGMSPLIGRWSLDIDRVPAEERPRSVTIEFRPEADNAWATRVVVTGVDGATLYAYSTAIPGGDPAPVTGTMGIIDQVSLRQPSRETLVMSLAKDGAPVSSRVYTVSKDGESMTETIVWAGSAVPKLETNHFKRAS